MAKNMKRILALVLVMVMFASALPMQALAVEPEHTTEISPEGLVTDVYTTENETADENGKTTIVVSIKKETDGEFEEDGNTVTLDRDVTETTTIKENADGSTTTEVIVDGSEVKEWTEEVQAGDEVPEVSVALIPGENSASASSEPETTGQIVDGNGETITTVIEREVTVTTEDLTEATGDEHGEIIAINPIAPDEYEGKKDIVDEAYVGSDNAQKDLFRQGGLYGGWGMATSWLESIVPAKDENGNPIVDENGDPIYVLSPDAYYEGQLIDGKVPESILIESGERSRAHDIYFQEVTYQYDADGNVMVDADGNPIYDLSAKGTQHVAQMILWGNNGKAYYAYSIASSDEALVGPFSSGYEAEVMSKSEQFKDDPEKQSHIRGIATHGYWGASNEDEATGSLAKIKAEMTAAVEAGLELNLNGSSDKEAILAAIENLNEGDALVATQAALWAITQGTTDNIDGEVTKVLTGEFSGDSNGYTSLIYQYLLTVTEQEEEIAAIDKDALNLTVGEKVDEKENGDGVYTASLNFSLTVVPGENDELCVVLKYIDADGNLQEVKKTLGEELVANEDDSYTLTGLKLSENQDIEFDLKLEGIQYLEDAVFVHTATHTNTMKETGTIGARHSTLVSVGDASAAIDSSIHFSMNFTVDEEKHVIVRTEWYDEDTSTDVGDTEEEDEPEIFRLDIDVTEEIPEEAVPLAAPVTTGDNSFPWMLIAVMAAFGIVIVDLLGKKKAV